MRRTYLLRIAAVIFLLSAGNAYAQVRKPAPTGQVPKSYTGQQGNSYSEFKPKPTGQIAPAEGAVPQQTTNQGNAAPQIPGALQQRVEGQVPKVNSNQDARTFPERYDPNPAIQSESVITTQETRTLPGQNQVITTGQSVQTDVTTPADQTNANTTQAPRAANQQTQRTTTQPRAATTAPAVPTTPQRLQPNY